jgi:uncharacterized protein YigA (DUF484 family)
VAGLIDDANLAQTTDEEQVIAWLRTHPDLLERHPDLLEALELSHASGAAVSLIERQVELLRAKTRRLEDRAATLIDIARDNERRANNMHRLARTLIRSPSLAAVASGLRNCMREDFDIDEVFVGVNGTAFLRHDIEGIVPIEPESAIARAFDNFFRTRLIECGPIDESRAKLLFPRSETPIRSAAVVPMERDKNLGMIALGSRDAERFQPRQGKLFLEMTAELIAAAVRARLT